jgi:hypothetical protein
MPVGREKLEERADRTCEADGQSAPLADALAMAKPGAWGKRAKSLKAGEAGDRRLVMSICKL